MISISTVFTIIISLFFILLIVKSLTKKNFCVICLSFVLTWAYLLCMLFNNSFEDKVLLGIFMGQTSIGIYYLLEIKLRKRFHIFRLPFLLTLTIIIYSILSYSSEVISAIKLTIAIWILFMFIFVYRKSPKAKTLANKIIECCKRW